MVIIRLARRGTNKRPFYHIVVKDSRSSRDGRCIEELGYFNPIAQGQEARTRVNLARVDHWVATGAQLSERVKQILKEARKNPEMDTSAQKAA